MNKYNARKVKIDNYTFDSMREGARYRELKLLERANEIEALQVHPVFTLIDGFEYRGENIRKIKYVADFQYIENGEIVVEDVKGIITAVARLKIKLFKLRYPSIDFRIVK